MGQRCGCVDTACGCEFVAGPGVLMYGSGSTANPLTIESSGEITSRIVTLNTTTVALGLSGDGSSANPYALSADSLPGETTIDTTVFFESGTWTKPARGSLAEITCIGGGGGGGAGAAQANGSTFLPSAGPGGQGGDLSTAMFVLSDLPTTTAITIGAGGSGSTVAAVLGPAGGATSFGNKLLAGGQGTNNAGLIYIVYGSLRETFRLGAIVAGTAGGKGYRGPPPGTANVDRTQYPYTPALFGLGGGAGGAGGGVVQYTSPRTLGPAVQGGGQPATSQVGGAGGVVDGSNGSPGQAPIVGKFVAAGTGGGGGATGVTGSGGRGGDGGRGAGGGGGGASTPYTANSIGGPGGRGGDGLVVIKIW